MSEGRSTIRDPATGRFVKASLEPETAAEMGRISHGKKRGTKANKLLQEAGYTDDNPAPEHLQVLAEYAVGGKSGAVAALRDFRRLTSAGDEDISAQPGKPAPGSICPLCNELVMTDFRPSPSQLQQASDFLERYGPRQEPREPPPQPKGTPFDTGE